MVGTQYIPNISRLQVRCPRKMTLHFPNIYNRETATSTAAAATTATTIDNLSNGLYYDTIWTRLCHHIEETDHILICPHFIFFFIYSKSSNHFESSLRQWTLLKSSCITSLDVGIDLLPALTPSPLHEFSQYYPHCFCIHKIQTKST